MSLWYTFLYQPLVNILIFLYQALGNNLGLAIIGATILIRLLLLPIMLPSMRSAQKMQQIKPEFDKLKEKHGNDKQALAKAQMELYQKHGINPAAGLLPMIVQFLVLIALYQAFNKVINPNGGISELNDILYQFIDLPANATLNTNFLYLNLTKPDVFKLPFELNLGIVKISTIPGVFLLASAFSQFFSSKILRPATTLNNQATKNDSEDMMFAMQKQMNFLIPLMTIFIGINFPSGLVLYWLTYSLVLIAQQFFIKKS
jgi:YidC/Oxa1 family membrane protein insertase